MPTTAMSIAGRGGEGRGGEGRGGEGRGGEGRGGEGKGGEGKGERSIEAPIVRYLNMGIAMVMNLSVRDIPYSF